MRNKLFWILLAASVALNVFFVAGVVYSEYFAPGPGERAERRIAEIGERLELTEAQVGELMALRQRARDRRGATREGRQEMRARFIEELGKPEFDRDEVIRLMEERWRGRQARFADMAAELHAYLATLSPQQRQQFLVMARERGFLRGLFGRSRRDRSTR
jgi:Spy/CpxP family protein refolding chaperone